MLETAEGRTIDKSGLIYFFMYTFMFNLVGLFIDLKTFNSVRKRFNFMAKSNIYIYLIVTYQKLYCIQLTHENNNIKVFDINECEAVIVIVHTKYLAQLLTIGKVKSCGIIFFVS